MLVCEIQRVPNVIQTEQNVTMYLQNLPLQSVSSKRNLQVVDHL